MKGEVYTKLDAHSSRVVAKYDARPEDHCPLYSQG